MTLQPKLPSLDGEVADLLRRVGILEALSPGAALIITDGSVTVDPTDEIDIDPEGLTLTDLTGGVAGLAISDYTPFSPTLTADTTNPTLGTSPTLGGGFVQLKHFVHYWGSINFGAGATLGVGAWEISLPVAASSGGILGIAHLKSFLSSPLTFWFRAVITDEVTTFNLQYLDAFPMGNEKFFGSTAGWTLQADDFLYWNLVYYSNT